MSFSIKPENNLKSIIKVDYDLTLSNCGWIPRVPTYTDDEIIYYLAHKSFYGPRMSKNNHLPEDTPENVKLLFDQKMSKLVPDDLEFIPRKYWFDIRELIGSDANCAMHPVWQITHRAINYNFKPTSKILIIQACANSKPYIDNQNFVTTTKKYQRTGLADVAACSYELTPIDFTPMFPFRYYNWNHAWETPYATDVLADAELGNIINILTHFDYKYVIFYTPGGDDYFYNHLYQKITQIYQNSPIKFYFIWTRELCEQQNMQKGILKVRYEKLPLGRQKLESIINQIVKEDPNSVRIKKPYKDGLYYTTGDERYIEYLINRRIHDKEEIEKPLQLTEEQIKILQKVDCTEGLNRLIIKKEDYDILKQFVIIDEKRIRIQKETKLMINSNNSKEKGEIKMANHETMKDRLILIKDGLEPEQEYSVDFLYQLYQSIYPDNKYKKNYFTTYIYRLSTESHKLFEKVGKNYKIKL